MSGRLEGQHALVTGAGRGLGRAVARALAREGASVSICARTGSELENTLGELRRLGGNAEAFQTDLGDPHACEELIAQVLLWATRIDVLVNNAAVLQLTPIEALSYGQWADTLAVNLTAPYLLIRGLLPAMRRGGGGSIINVSSRAGVLGFKHEAAYCSSKFGLEGLTRALAKELSDSKVSINTVTPGLKIKPTSMRESELERLPEDKRRSYADPQALCPAFLWLARLRGELSGYRFDARRLSEALGREGFDLPPSRAAELAEATP